MKITRIDYSAGDLLSDLGGELTPAEFGIYWMICTLIYRRLDWIDDDAQWIAGKFKRPGSDPRTIRAAIERLVTLGKIIRADDKLMVNRCRKEIERASNRIQAWTKNGSNGGRPLIDQSLEPNEFNALNKPNGPDSTNPAFSTNTSTNNSTNTDSSLHSESVAPLDQQELTHEPGSQRRGTRLPPDWRPGDECRLFAESLGLDPGVVLAGFRDYWLAKATGATKLDWDATWRSWCRRETGDIHQHGHGGSRRLGYRQGTPSLIAAARAVGAGLKDEPGV